MVETARRDGIAHVRAWLALLQRMDFSSKLA